MKEHTEVANLGNNNNELNIEECVQVVSCGGDNFHLWHEQLGHFNVEDIKLLARYNLVEGLLLKNEWDLLPFCEGCMLGKQHQKPFLGEGTLRWYQKWHMWSKQFYFFRINQNCEEQ